MSRYTLKGSVGLDARIDADLLRIAEEAAPFSEAGILLGGYGRGEGTPYINADGSQSPFNDYDLVVVVGKLNRAVRDRFTELGAHLSKEIGLPVDLCPYRRRDLPACEFSLLNYEMKQGHKVVWGNADILEAMPDYPHDAIPPFEGSRLLMNRGKLLLDIRQRLKAPAPLTDEERIRFIKFVYKVLLAFGDCALLAEGKYDISYSVKKERISTIAEIPDRAAVIEGYLRAVELKEWGDYRALTHLDLTRKFVTVRDVFLRFFPWYRSQYTQRECSRLKAAALNLNWNGCPLPSHPRLRLYDALQELLKDEPDRILLSQILFCRNQFSEKFYTLQRRFS